MSQVVSEYTLPDIVQTELSNPNIKSVHFSDDFSTVSISRNGIKIHSFARCERNEKQVVSNFLLRTFLDLQRAVSESITDVAESEPRSRDEAREQQFLQEHPLRLYIRECGKVDEEVCFGRVPLDLIATTSRPSYNVTLVRGKEDLAAATRRFISEFQNSAEESNCVMTNMIIEFPSVRTADIFDKMLYHGDVMRTLALMMHGMFSVQSGVQKLRVSTIDKRGVKLSTMLQNKL